MTYQHSYSCEYPEGCSCGATHLNALEEYLQRYEDAPKEIARVVDVASTRPKALWTVNSAAEIGNKCGDIARKALKNQS